MSIKLSDLTCEKCIYAYVCDNNRVVQCRRSTPDTWEKVSNHEWCGEGKWLTKHSEFEPYMTRETIFLTYENLEKDEIVNPHEA